MATVALAGHPNCGKTSLFNALTGARHHVGNWPGITAERHSGTVEAEDLTPLTALAFMVFTPIYTPCLGTVGMSLKETRSWAWTAFSVGYGIGLGWLLAWLTVIAGRALGFA